MLRAALFIWDFCIILGALHILWRFVFQEDSPGRYDGISINIGDSGDLRPEVHIISET
jgi:hypothetical protein